MPFGDDPTPEDQILPIEEFKKLTLHTMLQKLPVISLGPTTANMAMKAYMPRIVCADGTSLSIQASENHYCSPRNNTGPYSSVEVGFIETDIPPSWLEFCEDPTKPQSTIFAYVPIELVCFYIAGHGGMDIEKTFEGFRYAIH